MYIQNWSGKSNNSIPIQNGVMTFTCICAHTPWSGWTCVIENWTSQISNACKYMYIVMYCLNCKNTIILWRTFNILQRSKKKVKTWTSGLQVLSSLKPSNRICWIALTVKYFTIWKFKNSDLFWLRRTSSNILLWGIGRAFDHSTRRVGSRTGQDYNGTLSSRASPWEREHGREIPWWWICWDHSSYIIINMSI